MKKTLIALMTGLFTLTLIAADGAAFTDYSSGFGYVPDGGLSIGYEAQGELQAATGEFDFRRSNRNGQGEGFHADVTCLNAPNDTEAWLIIEIEETNGDFEGYRTVYVQDNGDGNSDGTWDRFRIRETRDHPETSIDCDRDDDDRGNSREIRGDIVVEDSGFATP